MNENVCSFKLHVLLLKIRINKYDSNIESKSLNNTYLNIIKIFNKLFLKMNITEMQNLVVKLTRKKGHLL